MSIAAALEDKLNNLYSTLTPEQTKQIEEIQTYYQAGIYNVAEWYYKTLDVIDPIKKNNL